jgi:hypothetical protein
MGHGKWDPGTWSAYSTSTVKGKTVDAIYTSRSLDKELNPMNVIRESCDSDINPKSNAIIIAEDVTGSMSIVLEDLIRNGLPTLLKELYDRKPVDDPHVMLMGIGDAEAGDRAPLQVTQFEADIRIAEQLTKIFLERGGGGNNYESYILAWYFAAMHTKIDCFEKRNKKGYLFTIGDEQPTPYLRPEDIKRLIGDDVHQRLSAEDVLTMVNRKYHTFHIMVEEGAYFRSASKLTVDAWTNLLGQRAIRLPDHTKISEVIVSAIQIVEGAKHEDVVKSWDGTTAVVIDKALKNLDSVVETSPLFKF